MTLVCFSVFIPCPCPRWGGGQQRGKGERLWVGGMGGAGALLAKSNFDLVRRLGWGGGSVAVGLGDGVGEFSSRGSFDLAQIYVDGVSMSLVCPCKVKSDLAFLCKHI